MRIAFRSRSQQFVLVSPTQCVSLGECLTVKCIELGRYTGETTADGLRMVTFLLRVQDTLARFTIQVGSLCNHFINCLRKGQSHTLGVYRWTNRYGREWSTIQIDNKIPGTFWPEISRTVA